MMHPDLHSRPRVRLVLLEHVRTLGLALRVPAAVAAGLLGLATLLVVFGLPGQGDTIDFRPERHMLPVLLALVFSMIVWRGEDRFGFGFLWTVPVDRRRHALTRVLAGWVWLMGAVALFVLWLLALTFLSGGILLREETIHVLTSSLPAPGTGPDPGVVQTVRLTPQPLFWLTPFTAATGAYLLASAVALGLRHPLRWIVGTALGLQLVVIAGDATNVEWLRLLPSRLLRPLYAGPYGIDTLLSARTESVGVWVTLSTGELVHVWRALPHLGQWAAGTLLWTGIGLVLLWAAASRHRELRHA
jgi:hypothetical protein